MMTDRPPRRRAGIVFSIEIVWWKTFGAGFLLQNTKPAFFSAGDGILSKVVKYVFLKFTNSLHRKLSRIVRAH